MKKEDIMIKDHESKLNGMLSSFNTIAFGGFEIETKYVSSSGYDSKLIAICTIILVKSPSKSNDSVVYEIITEYFCSVVATTIKEKPKDYKGNRFTTYDNFNTKTVETR